MHTFNTKLQTSSVYHQCFHLKCNVFFQLVSRGVTKNKTKKNKVSIRILLESGWVWMALLVPHNRKTGLLINKPTNQKEKNSGKYEPALHLLWILSSKEHNKSHIQSVTFHLQWLKHLERCMKKREKKLFLEMRATSFDSADSPLLPNNNIYKSKCI